jgi:hypothetical protein
MNLQTLDEQNENFYNSPTPEVYCLKHNPDNIIPITWFEDHEDTKRATWNPALPVKPKKPKPKNLYAIYRTYKIGNKEFNKRLECPPMLAKEIDKRAKEQKGAEGLPWFFLNGYNLKVMRG